MGDRDLIGRNSQIIDVKRLIIRVLRWFNADTLSASPGLSLIFWMGFISIATFHEQTFLNNLIPGNVVGMAIKNTLLFLGSGVNCCRLWSWWYIQKILEWKLQNETRLYPKTSDDSAMTSGWKKSARLKVSIACRCSRKIQRYWCQCIVIYKLLLTWCRYSAIHLFTNY